MIALDVQVPDAVLISLKTTPTELARDISLLAAVKLFELGRLSSGRAAEMAGLSRVMFLTSLWRYGVCALQSTAEELAEDVLNA